MGWTGRKLYGMCVCFLVCSINFSQDKYAISYYIAVANYRYSLLPRDFKKKWRPCMSAFVVWIPRSSFIYYSTYLYTFYLTIHYRICRRRLWKCTCNNENTIKADKNIIWLYSIFLSIWTTCLQYLFYEINRIALKLKHRSSQGIYYIAGSNSS